MTDPAATGLAGRGSTWWKVLAVVWVAAALCEWHFLDRGWLPHDEGTLAQSAERLLGGELPHRDFDEVWTGGLTFLNAGAFGVFGLRLVALRFPLFAVFLLWVPALYYIATRFARPAVAGAVTALGVAWSLPQYSAAVPSWYNLFFATFAAAALLRAVETERRRWLFAAGVVLGLSMIFKIAGLFCVAAVLLWFVYRESTLVRPPGLGSRSYATAIGTALAAFVAALVWLVHRRLAIGEVSHFVLPGAALAVLAYRECIASAAGGWARFGSMVRMMTPFVAGLALPIAILVVSYVHLGAFGMLWNDVFIAPVRRLDLAARSLPNPATDLAALPIAWLIGLLPLSRLPPLARRITLSVSTVALVAFLVLSRHPVWYSIRPLLPLTVVVGAWVLARRDTALAPLRRQQLFVLLAMAAMWSLVQFPFAWPPYFFYVAPLAAVSALAVLESLGPRPGLLGGMVLLLFLVFAFVNTHPSRHPQVRLALERGGLVVGAPDAARYEALVGLLRSHASGGYTYAAPDCPEVYFLAGLANPTRTLWEFLSDTTGQTAHVLRALEDHHVTAIALNRVPPFSGPLPKDLEDSLAARYPRMDSLDLFTVRWRP